MTGYYRAVMVQRELIPTASRLNNLIGERVTFQTWVPTDRIDDFAEYLGVEVEAVKEVSEGREK